MKNLTSIAALIFCVYANAKNVDVERLGSPVSPVLRASEVTNISFTGTVPATFTGALDADDSTYNRLTTCTALSGVGTATAFDTVVITNNSGAAGNVTITSSLVGGAACTDANDTFFTLYSSFNPATPIANCLAINDDISGATNRCSRLTFPLAASEVRTVVVTSFDNAATATGLFPYEISFAGTTGGGGASPTYSSSPAPGAAVNLAAAGSANLVITNGGAVGAGALNVTLSGLSGAIGVTPLTGAIAVGTPATFAVRCANTATTPVTQTLSIVHNGTGAPASPVTHVVTCAGVAPAAAVVQAPAMGSFGILGLMLGFLGLGVFAARRYS
jgi:hypothetical protein